MLLGLLPSAVQAQEPVLRQSASPVAPSSAVGAVTSAPTVSVMGLTGLPTGEDGAMPPRDLLFMGLSQPVGRIRGVRFTAIGTGYWRARDAVGGNSAAEGAVALRALGRVNGVRSWGAVSYGRAGALGGAPGGAFGATPNNVGFDGVHTDTTISRRVDIGTVARVEGGVLGSKHGVEMSLGMSVERATRVTTQTLRIEATGEVPMLPMHSTAPITRTLRGVQRREIATGLASLGWRTGPTGWLASVAAPVAAWITPDALAPRPRMAPAVASLAIMQPITAWLSVVGAASTNASTVGSTALRDDVALTRRSDFAPVLALGISLARVPFRGRHGEVALNGILSFESHVVETIDSLTFVESNDGDSVRVSVNRNPAYRVQVLIDAPAAASVELMGDATAWNVANMSRGTDGRWRVELKLPVGAHRLSVRVDGGEWVAPPGLPLGSNDFGSPVGLLVLEPPTTRR